MSNLLQGSLFWHLCLWIAAAWRSSGLRRIGRAVGTAFRTSATARIGRRLLGASPAVTNGSRVRRLLARYNRGLWVVAEGLIYTCFNPKMHVVPAQERAYDKYYISCDYGTINPTSMGLWGRVGGKWYRIAEYYFDSRREKRQQTDAEYYEQLCKLAGDRKIHAVIVDPSAASFIETIRRGGRFRVEPASNAVLDGIRDVSTQLQQGNLFINDCCRDCIREFGLYRWDEKAASDKPLKTDDHSMDDLRYFVHTAFAPPRFSF